MKLFQYWDKANPPQQVKEWIEGIKADNPDFEHILLNEETAGQYIQTHYGDR